MEAMIPMAQGLQRGGYFHLTTSQVFNAEPFYISWLAIAVLIVNRARN